MIKNAAMTNFFKADIAVPRSLIPLASYQYQGFKKLVSKTAKFVRHFTVYLSLPPTVGQLAERRPLDFSNYRIIRHTHLAI